MTDLLDNRLCWDCRHIHFNTGRQGSEHTPGEQFELRCRKDHWELHPQWMGEVQSLKLCLSHAPTCSDFETPTGIRIEVRD